MEGGERIGEDMDLVHSENAAAAAAVGVGSVSQDQEMVDQADADTTISNVHSTPTPQAKVKNVTEMNNHSVINSAGEMSGYDETGTAMEREAFMKELESFYRSRSLEFKPPKFYGVPLNCLKTCTTVSWTFRIFYEKALLEYEKHKRETGELQLPVGSLHQPSSVEKEAPGSGRARRDAAARAMQGWHAQRLLGYGEVAESAVKDKNFSPTQKREKNLKSIGVINKQRMPSGMDHADKTANIEGDRQLVTAVVDIGPPADWVKINVRETKDCFEVYALVPGLLREEVVNLPSRIDPLQTSAIVSLHGRLFVRVPFEQGAV
ncbi:variant 2, AT-rich interactive domain-containing protein 5 [Lathyrus oleraceus]|uniref:Variant 2, AT-rich interactive domain-containing protein 5 n=1 Tax=Pisum sativum TaxID=3888 RepID=A0A9D4WGX7_PEA|nr:variant 2, AT-rich interactive domain-containing protein 5 [Pisum sativum]